jgi:hypothetical protein
VRSTGPLDRNNPIEGACGAIGGRQRGVELDAALRWGSAPLLLAPIVPPSVRNGRPPLSCLCLALALAIFVA